MQSDKTVPNIRDINCGTCYWFNPMSRRVVGHCHVKPPIVDLEAPVSNTGTYPSVDASDVGCGAHSVFNPPNRADTPTVAKRVAKKRAPTTPAKKPVKRVTGKAIPPPPVMPNNTSGNFK